jgi:hypothetical protein
MVGTRREPSTNVRTRVEPPWCIVGQQRPSAHGSIVRSRSARVRAVTVPCMSATTAIIICGHGRDRPQWSTVWGVVRTPHATVGGSPSALKPNGPSACPAGVWAGMCCAGLVLAALPVSGRCLNGGRHDRTPLISGGPPMRSRPLLAAPQPCWRPGRRIQSGGLMTTGRSRRWC